MNDYYQNGEIKGIQLAIAEAAFWCAEVSKWHPGRGHQQQIKDYSKREVPQ